MSDYEEDFIIVDEDIEENAPKNNKSVEKMPVKGFTERENDVLVKRYIEYRSEYHEKFKTGSKNGPSKQDILARKWAVELSGISGMERTAAQIKQRLADLRKRVRKCITDERTSVAKTGGGKGRAAKLDEYLLPLKEAMLTDENITGIEGGYECGQAQVKEEEKAVKMEPLVDAATPSRTGIRQILKATRRLPDVKQDIRQEILEREVAIKNEELKLAEKKNTLADLKLEIAKQRLLNAQLEETLITTQLQKHGVVVNYADNNRNVG